MLIMQLNNCFAAIFLRRICKYLRRTQSLFAIVTIILMSNLYIMTIVVTNNKWNDIILLSSQSQQKRDLKDYVKYLENMIPNLPLSYLKSHENNASKTCAKLPKLHEININNDYWQVLVTTNGTYYLFGAYYDQRQSDIQSPSIRVLGFINWLNPVVKTFCQIWFEGDPNSIIVEVSKHKWLWWWGEEKPRVNQPYMLTCPLPDSERIPVAVSLVEQECDKSTNILKVIYNTLEGLDSKQDRFAVCVKGLSFPYDDLSIRLVEWIELLNVLGANKIFLYVLDVHSNVTKVLDHYSSQGMVDVTPITLPGNMPNVEKLQHEHYKKAHRFFSMIPYNDCLLRNLYRYEYITMLDIDEVIMPLKTDNWIDMMKDLTLISSKHKDNTTWASYNFLNVYFMEGMLKAMKPHTNTFKDIPPYLHMMQHVFRSENYTKRGFYIKSFHRTDEVLIVHNHYAMSCASKSCRSFEVNKEDGHLQHYRDECVIPLKSVCEEQFQTAVVKDTSVWRYKDVIIERTSDALNKLGFIDV